MNIFFLHWESIVNIFSDKCLHWKKERSQVNNVTLHLKELEKGEQTKVRVSCRKEIIAVRAGIN